LAGPTGIPGDGVTLTVTWEVHDTGEVQVITAEVPVVIPVTMPVVNPTEALPGALLVQVLPGILDDSVMVAPTHNAVGPVMMGKGLTFTVTEPVMVLPQPEAG